MAKSLIPQDFIDRVVDAVDIVDLVGESIQLKKAGSNHKACCPFHEEKTPSFTVSEDKQFYHCFGCGENGNALRWMLNYRNMDFREAVEALAVRAGMELPKEEITPGAAKGNSRAKYEHDFSDYYDAISKLKQSFKSLLRTHTHSKHAINYFKVAGFSGQTASDLEFGFWADQDAVNASGRFSKSDLSALKALKLDKCSLGPGAMCITIPIIDTRGRDIGFYLANSSNGKSLSAENAVFNHSDSLYGVHQHRQSIRENNSVFVLNDIESAALAFQSGYSIVISTVNDHLGDRSSREIIRLAPNIRFVFKEDNESVWENALKLLSMARPSHNIGFNFIDNQNDVFRHLSLVSGNGWDLSDDGSTSLADYVVNNLLNDADDTSLFVERSREAMSTIPQGILKTLMIKSLSDSSGIDYHAFSNALESDSSQILGGAGYDPSPK